MKVKVRGTNIGTIENEQQNNLRDSGRTLYRKTPKKVVAPQEFPMSKYLESKTTMAVRDSKQSASRKQSDSNMIKHHFVLKLQKQASKVQQAIASGATTREEASPMRKDKATE